MKKNYTTETPPTVEKKDTTVRNGTSITSVPIAQSLNPVPANWERRHETTFALS